MLKNVSWTVKLIYSDKRAQSVGIAIAKIMLSKAQEGIEKMDDKLLSSSQIKSLLAGKESIN